MSSAEAEYMAISESTKEAIYIRRLLTEIIGKLKATVIFCDNQSAGLMTKNPVFHEGTKHIDIRYHFVRDSIEKSDVKVEYIPTDTMPADVLTKELSLPKHKKFIKDIGLRH